MSDEFDRAFPGDGLELPSDEERDRADAMIARFNLQQGEQHPPVARVHPDVTGEGYASYLAGVPTNRAYLRSQLRRWWHRRM